MTQVATQARAKDPDLNAVTRELGRARYIAAQGARVAWFTAHSALAARVSQPFAEDPGQPKFQPKAQPGDKAQIRRAFFDLFLQDRRNIEAGLYPAPSDLGLRQAREAIDASMRFLLDLPKVAARRRERAGVEVRERDERGRLPTYYVQNFHYQTGGWLTEESAKLYDTQVEVLFTGAADAMRRIALGSLVRGLRGRDQRYVQHLDIACGNGRFLSQIMTALPRLAASGLDLSPAYLAEAKRRLTQWPRVELFVGAAESLPFGDASLDAVTNVYLFHELPPRVRRSVAAEIARVLKPGGVFVFADSLQTGDAADLDYMLEWFPVGFHEPFYGSYLGEDLIALFAEAGLRHVETELAFLTKIMRFEKA